MARDLRFYIDYKSPYAYLTKDPVYDLEREFGVIFTLAPINLYIPDFLGTVEGPMTISGGGCATATWTRGGWRIVTA